MHQSHNRFRARKGLAAAIALGVVCVVTAPSAAAQSAYPDLAEFTPVGSSTKYRVTDRDGVWFSTGIGIICSIGDDGSYGCSGTLAGAPAGENEIAWFPGDPFPRLYHTDQPRFDSGTTQTILTAKSVIRYHGSTCAATFEQGVYCINGADLDSQILVSAWMTFRGRNAQPIS